MSCLICGEIWYGQFHRCGDSMGLLSLEDYVERYWLEHYVDEEMAICMLCQNTGLIDTSASQAKDAWRRTVKLFPCICPNGQAKRKMQQEAEA